VVFAVRVIDDIHPFGSPGKQVESSTFCEKEAMALVSQRAYARHRGVSLAAVQKAIKLGRIRTTADGKIDVEQADRDWERNTNYGGPVAAGDAIVSGPSYAQSRAVREVYTARLAKLEYEERIGKLVPADQVTIAGFTKGRTVRDHMMIIPDRVAAQIRADLAGALTAACRDLSIPVEIAESALAKIDLDHIHGLLSNEIRTVLVEIGGLPDHGG
jgi:hypothetical protein